MQRRVFLLLAAGTPLVIGSRPGALGRPRSAPAVLAGASPPARPAQEARQAESSQVALPQVAADGPLPSASLSTLQVYQGGTLRVNVDKAVSGTALAFGREYPLGTAGAGLEGFVGFGTEDPPGATTVSVDAVEASGMAFRYDFTVRVLGTAWTFDDIIIPPPPPPPPEPNAPPPPPPPPDEAPLLPGIYAGLTPRKWRPSWRSPLDVVVISGYFGEERSFNGGPRGGHHGGTDYAADAGTPVRSTNDGVVVMSGLYLTRGNMVVVDHGAGVFSLYGHMAGRAVAAGDTVRQGDVVGYVGSTGLSTGPHLHWEMSVSGVLVDGLRWLDGSQGF